MKTALISDFKNRIIITKYSPPTQTAGGGLLPGAAIGSFTKWAFIESRSGVVVLDSQQREWNYDFKIRVRYTKSFVESSNDLITFEGKTLIIKSVSFEDEGAKRVVILKCSVNE